MSKIKTLPKKLIGDNLRVRLILNEEEGLSRASIGGSQARERRANILNNKKSEYTYHLGRIIVAVVLIFAVLGGIAFGIRALLNSSAKPVQRSIVLAPVLAATENSVSATPENVVRAVLASGIRGGVPKAVLKKETVSLKKLPSRYVYFFTEVNGLNGENLYHVWQHKGKTTARIKIKVGDSLWRSYSGELMSKKKIGSWKVNLLDDSGNILASRDFVLVK